MFSKIKMAFNAVGAWILNVFAAIMRNCFPQLCCKYLTRKGNRNAQKFPPSLEEQKKAYNRMLSDVVPKHVWSKEFRVWLLQMKEYALINDCASQKELEEVLFKPCSTEIRSIAVRRCTPNHTTILRFVNATEKFDEVLDLATAVPAAFASLTAEDVLSRGTGKRSELMWVMINKYPTRAIDYLNLILSNKFLKERCGDDVPFLADIAIAKQLNFESCLEQLKANYPAVYANVREHAMDMGANSVSLVLKGFSLTSEALSLHMQELIDDLSMVSISGNLEDSYDAMAWLSICYQMLDKQAISNMILDNWNFIKMCVRHEVYQQLSYKLVRNISDPFQAKKALELLDKAFKPMIIDKLLNNISDKDIGVLSDLFPFNDWSDEQQKKAIRIMIECKRLPEDWKSKISEELQKIAFEEMEIQAELAVIRFGHKEEIKELIAHKLHSRSEIELFCRTCTLTRMVEYGHEYSEHIRMDDSSFKAMMELKTDDDGRPLSFGEIEKLIRIHAKKWGLSAKNYQDLLRSPYSSLAPLLKGCVRFEREYRTPSFEDGV